MKKRWGQKRVNDASRRGGGADTSRTRQAVNTSYMRSRTISAYAPIVNPDLSRLSVHELRRHRHRLIRILIVCLAVIGILAILTTQVTASTGTLSYSPALIREPDTATIDKAVDDYYASRPLERLRFLVNEATLGQYLASRVPEIAGIQSVTSGGIGTTNVSLSMRVPVASWKINNQTLYVDKDGVSFTHDYYSSPLVEVDDQSGASTGSSSAVASSSMIRYIGQLIAALKNDGTGTVTKVVLPGDKIRELDVYLEGRAYRVKVQLDRDVSSQAADIQKALPYIDAHGGAGEYVDARVPGKVFYK